MNEWLRRLCNTHGYGVQSPSDFYFVQHVLRETSPYYAYEPMRRMVEQYKGRAPLCSLEICQLLFRLTDYARPHTIIEVGGGLSAFAMAMARPSVRCISVMPEESCASMHPLLAEWPNVELKSGDEMAIFSDLLGQTDSLAMLHVARTNRYREVVDLALQHVADTSLIVIEDIRSDEEKLAWWISLQESGSVSISYDLGSIGVLFFNKSRHKERYSVKVKGL